MNDDGSTPTPAHGTPLTGRTRTAELSELHVDIPEKDLRLLDSLNHEQSLDDSEDARPSTSEEEADNAEYLLRAQRRMSATSDGRGSGRT